MDQLTNTQREYLRRLAHDLKPTAHVGKNGVTENVIAAIDQALDSHELIKVKFGDFQEQKKEIATDVSDQLGAILVTIIGNIAVFYREQPDDERRKIRLPRG
jgi:RNA-binding protein